MLPKVSSRMSAVRSENPATPFRSSLTDKPLSPISSHKLWSLPSRWLVAFSLSCQLTFEKNLPEFAYMRTPYAYEVSPIAPKRLSFRTADDAQGSALLGILGSSVRQRVSKVYRFFRVPKGQQSFMALLLVCLFVLVFNDWSRRRRLVVLQEEMLWSGEHHVPYYTFESMQPVNTKESAAVSNLGATSLETCWEKFKIAFQALSVVPTFSREATGEKAGGITSLNRKVKMKPVRNDDIPAEWRK